MKISISNLSAVAAVVNAAKTIQDYCRCRYCGNCIFGDDQDNCLLHYHAAGYWFDEEGELNKNDY